ncbi:MAG: OB-fold domain-containing protein [Ilumatobacteraceae bacterium]
MVGVEHGDIDLCTIHGSFTISVLATLTDTIEHFVASGRGTIHTFTVTHQNLVPPFNEHLPDVLAYVELDEGPRVFTDIVGLDPADVAIAAGETDPRFTDHEAAKAEGLPGAVIPGSSALSHLAAMIRSGRCGRSHELQRTADILRCRLRTANDSMTSTARRPSGAHAVASRTAATSGFRTAWPPTTMGTSVSTARIAAIVARAVSRCSTEVMPMPIAVRRGASAAAAAKAPGGTSAPSFEDVEAGEADEIGDDGDRQAVALAGRRPEHHRAAAAPRAAEPCAEPGDEPQRHGGGQRLACRARGRRHRSDGRPRSAPPRSRRADTPPDPSRRSARPRRSTTRWVRRRRSAAR